MAVDADKAMQKQRVDHLLNWKPDGSHLYNNKPSTNLTGFNMMKR
tara:strand:- start:94 stop:228 length:135 start_codon:yes stop_codon:yes gene_type:complete